jgi:glycine cleavage system H protein
MKFDPTCLYQPSHEWIRVQGDEGVIGISDYAQSELNDVVYVIESVKAASELYMPVSGEILAVNEALEDEPERVNQDPFGEGWMMRVRIADPSELEDLLNAEAYKSLCHD